MTMHARGAAPQLRVKRTGWRALEAHYRKVRALHLRDLFSADRLRGERMTAEGTDIYLDYSKNRITDQTINLLVQLAEESGLQSRIDAMFRGEKINITENRAGLHVALRAPKGSSIYVDGENVVLQVQAVLDKMAHFSNSVRVGNWKGCTGKRIRNVINIGVGAIGSEMAYEALKAYSDRSISFRFVSGSGASSFTEAVRDLDPSETLFIVCSKSFTEPDTMTNAHSARTWLLAQLSERDNAVGRHFVAVSTNTDKAAEFGIENANIFGLREWLVEGYPIESASGLSTMLSIGPDNFKAMLNGFHQMDMHFLATPFDSNLPVLMGLLAVWYVNFFDCHAIAVLPYEHYLKRFPAYIQQLTMESNCKHVTLIGTEVTHATGPIYWGEVGSNGRRSFFQAMHQGTTLIPCDFIAFGKSLNPIGRQQDLVSANVLAETEALAFGKSAEQFKAEGTPDWLIPHRVLDGNRPSTIILAEQLTPEMLGKLLALYEHSVFTQGVIWNVNSFDHWGLDLTQALADKIAPELEGAEEPQHDSSTNALIHRLRNFKKSP